MVAWAIVSRLFIDEGPAESVWRLAVRMPCSSSHERQAGIGFFPGVADPDVIRILGDREGAGATGQEVEVLDVIAGTRNHGMESAVNQNYIAVAN